MAHVVTDANFAETLNTDKLVVVDFWQPGADHARQSLQSLTNSQPSMKERHLYASVTLMSVMTFR